MFNPTSLYTTKKPNRNLAIAIQLFELFCAADGLRRPIPFHRASRVSNRLGAYSLRHSLTATIGQRRRHPHHYRRCGVDRLYRPSCFVPLGNARNLVRPPRCRRYGSHPRAVLFHQAACCEFVHAVRRRCPQLKMDQLVSLLGLLCPRMADGVNPFG